MYRSSSVFGRICVFVASLWSDNIGYFGCRTFIGRYCFKYDFIRCLMLNIVLLNIVLIMYSNVISTGLPLGLFSTLVFSGNIAVCSLTF